jgi:hypothetical protein
MENEALLSYFLHQVPDYCPQYVINDYIAWDKTPIMRMNEINDESIDDLKQSPKRTRQFDLEETEQARRWDENPYQSSPVLLL